jgi:hypothetical protein
MLAMAVGAAKQEQAEMTSEFIASVNNTTFICKDDTKWFELEADCVRFLTLVEQRDSLSINVNMEKEDLIKFSALMNRVGVFCPQVKAKDYSESKADDAFASLVEVEAFVKEALANGFELPVEVRRALAVDVLMPLWAEVKNGEKGINEFGIQINAMSEKLFNRVATAYKSKASEYVFSGRWASVNDVMSIMIEKQEEAIEKRTLWLQNKAAEAAARKQQARSARRVAKAAETKQVVGNGVQVIEAVHTEAISNVIDLSWVRFNKNGETAGMMNKGLSVKARKAA